VGTKGPKFGLDFYRTLTFAVLLFKNVATDLKSETQVQNDTLKRAGKSADEPNSMT